jgi:hypothetical protein
VTNQLVEILTNRRDRIIAAAVGTFDRRAGRYGELPVEELHARFAGLFDQVLAVVADRNAIPALRYAEELARARFAGGYRLLDLQSASNALEEAIWQQVVAASDSRDVPGMLAAVTSAFAFVKDELARSYVELAAAAQPPMVDLDALMAGKAAR